MRMYLQVPFANGGNRASNMAMWCDPQISFWGSHHNVKKLSDNWQCLCKIPNQSRSLEQIKQHKEVTFFLLVQFYFLIQFFLLSPIPAYCLLFFLLPHLSHLAMSSYAKNKHIPQFSDTNQLVQAVEFVSLSVPFVLNSIPTSPSALYGWFSFGVNYLQEKKKFQMIRNSRKVFSQNIAAILFFSANTNTLIIAEIKTAQQKTNIRKQFLWGNKVKRGK